MAVEIPHTEQMGIYLQHCCKPPVVFIVRIEFLLFGHEWNIIANIFSVGCTYSCTMGCGKVITFHQFAWTWILIHALHYMLSVLLLANVSPYNDFNASGYHSFYMYCQISHIRHTKSKIQAFPVSPCSSRCPIHWSHVLSRYWRYQLDQRRGVVATTTERPTNFIAY